MGTKLQESSLSSEVINALEQYYGVILDPPEPVLARLYKIDTTLRRICGYGIRSRQIVATVIADYELSLPGK